MGFLKTSSWCCLLLIFSANVLPSTSLCLLDHHYIIRSKTTGLVLDSSSDRVVVTEFTGFNPQLWCLEYTSNPGILNIVSVDPLGHGLDAYTTGTDHSVYLNNRHWGSVSQEWVINGDGTIANYGSNNLCLDALGGDLSVGNPLELTECGGSAQWVFVEQ